MEHRTVKQEEDIAPEQSEPPGSGRPSDSTYAPTPLERSLLTEQSVSRTSRPALWAGVPDEQWDDWRWQLAHRLNSVDELAQIIHLTPEEIDFWIFHQANTRIIDGVFKRLNVSQ